MDRKSIPNPQHRTITKVKVHFTYIGMAMARLDFFINLLSKYS
jgi:hypothetical protein